MKKLIAAANLLLIVAASAWAQNAEPHYRGQGYAYFGLGAGLGGGVFEHPAVEQLGFGGEGFLYKGFAVGAEAGYAHWNFSQAWIGSADSSYHFRRHAPRGGVDPFVLLGVSVFGPTQKGGGRGTPVGNFGGGVNWWMWKHAALRFEFRDHIPNNEYIPGNHYISFRVGMTFR